MEVRTTPNRGLSLYATKSYRSGDIILEESPTFIFAPRGMDQIRRIRSEFRGLKPTPAVSLDDDDDTSDNDASGHKRGHKKRKTSKTKSSPAKYGTKDPTEGPETSCLFDLSLPPTIQSQGKGRFRGMLVAAACYALFSNRDNAAKNKSARDKDKTNMAQAIQNLYAPSIDDDDGDSKLTNDAEQNAVRTSRLAVEFLQTRTKPTGTLHTFATSHSQECQRMMLIWVCNAFEGGVVYNTTSRVNHSCDFNCVVSVSSVVLSFSPSAPSPLKQQKEGAAAERQILRAASDISPNEELTISYLGTFTYASRCIRRKHLLQNKLFHCSCSRCAPDPESHTVPDLPASVPCRACHPREGRYLSEDVRYDDDPESPVQYAVPYLTISDDTSNSGNTKWVCPICKDKTPDALFVDGSTTDDNPSKAAIKTIQNVETHLMLYPQRLLEQEEEEESLERLLCLSSSVLGSKHWCTNIVRLHWLGMQLTSIHSALLLRSAAAITTKHVQKDREEDEELIANLAECIDALQRLWTFCQESKLCSHPGHLLGSLTIGVARASIALGDEKSVQYGMEWASKVDEGYYRRGFEGKGMRMVVEALMNPSKGVGKGVVALEGGGNVSGGGNDEEGEQGEMKKAKLG